MRLKQPRTIALYRAQQSIEAVANGLGIAGLDLMISSCTAPLHLAGALRVPAGQCCRSRRISLAAQT